MSIREITSFALALALLAPAAGARSARADDAPPSPRTERPPEVACDDDGASEKDVDIEANVDANESYMWTVTKGALAGALLGATLGTTIWLIGQANDNPHRGTVILYPAAGGLVLGAGVGLWQVSTRDESLDAGVYDPFERPLTLEQAPQVHGVTLVHRRF